MLEQINAPGAFQTELLYAMSHPEEYITIDANHQPRPSRLLRQCLDLFDSLPNNPFCDGCEVTLTRTNPTSCHVSGCHN